MATPTDDSSLSTRPAQAGEGTRPSLAGEGTVTEIRKDDGRLLLLYRWPLPAGASR